MLIKVVLVVEMSANRPKRLDKSMNDSRSYTQCTSNWKNIDIYTSRRKTQV